MSRETRNFTDDKEEVLWYLIHKDREDDNTVALGTDRYKDIVGIAPERFIQVLTTLQDAGLVSLNFCGPVSHRSFCYVRLKDAGLLYFENQAREEEKDKAHDWNVQTTTVIAGALLAGVMAILLLLVELTFQ